MMPSRNPLDPIPHPPRTPWLGNLLSLGATSPVQNMAKLARQYWPIYWLDMRGKPLVVVSGHDLVDELCDESRFDKSVRGALRLVRNFAGDGLFTAYTQEPNWSKAHNILLPNFSQRAMQGYHAMMLDIALQLVLKWERLNADDEVDVVHDMTSLTLDTIALCGFDYRFNSFYRETNHPFVDAIGGALSGTMEQSGRLPLEDLIRKDRDRKLRADIRHMNETVDGIIRERRESGEDLGRKQDLLSYMLSGVDKKTGERLDDLNIRYQIITFLIAGHETTSGLLSFAIYALLNNPHVLARAYEEVDRVLGSDPSRMPSYAQVNQLTYVSQILKETLRLWPTAPAFALAPHKDTVIGGRYAMKKSYQIVVLVGCTPPRPRRVGGQRRGLRPRQLQPRGRARAARQCLQAIRQRPARVHRPPVRPAGGDARPRDDPAALRADRPQALPAQDQGKPHHQARRPHDHAQAPDVGRPLRRRAARRGDHDRCGAHRGGEPRAPGTLDPAARAVRVESRDGGGPRPPDRRGRPGPGLRRDRGPARRLRGAVAERRRRHDRHRVVQRHAARQCRPSSVTGCAGATLESGALEGVSYAVFGCGNQDWASTFQAIPRLIDDKLAEYGARRIMPRGEGDARDDFDGQFHTWYKPLWNTVAAELGIDLEGRGTPAKEPLYTVEIVPGQRMSPFVDSLGARAMTVTVNRELHRRDGPNPSDRSTRHVELELPAGVTYRAGDHLGVIAHNADALVKRVAARFGFERDAFVRLRRTGARKSFLPVDETISVYRLLGDYVELQDVATRSQIQTLVEHTECPWTRPRLAALAGDDEASAARYKAEVMATRKSLVDLLEEYPACALPFHVYLEMLSPLAPRYYSISSSPLRDERHLSITVGVVDAPARSGRGTYRGVCSNYLCHQEDATVIYAFVKDTKSAFRLPEDAATPIIMIGPGTGLAPFRGFLQERAWLKSQGTRGREIDALLRLPPSRAGLPLRRRAGRPRSRRSHRSQGRVLPASRREEDVRPGSAPRGAGRGVADDRERRRRLRVRRREPDGPRRAARVRGHPCAADRRGRGRRQSVAR